MHRGYFLIVTAAAVLLARAGLVLKMAGIALWPAVTLHPGLAIWCGLCLLAKPHDEFARRHSKLMQDPEQPPNQALHASGRQRRY